MAEYKQGGNQLHPLNESEGKFAMENLHLVDRFLKIKKLNPEIFYDIVIFDYLLAVEIYLGDTELRQKCNFEQVSFKYMERAVLNDYRANKQQKRCSMSGLIYPMKMRKWKVMHMETAWMYLITWNTWNC